MYRELLLAVTVSIDTYIAAAAYCNSGIKIPLLSSVLINLICSAVLLVSLLFSGMIVGFFPPELFMTCGRCVISAIGLLTILKSFMRNLVKRVEKKGELSVKLGKTPLAVKLYLDDTAADTDHSKILSAGEAAALALAISVDSAAIGLSSGFSDISPLAASCFTFICGAAAIWSGGVTGRKISSLNHDMSWLGGSMLIIFAIIT